MTQSGKGSKRKRPFEIEFGRLDTSSAITPIKRESSIQEEKFTVHQHLQSIQEGCIKRQKITADLYYKPHLTMREGIIRILEGNIDPMLLREVNDGDGNASSDDEA